MARAAVKSPAQSTLIIVTDDPQFVEPALAPGDRIRRWSAQHIHGADEFAGDPTLTDTFAWAQTLTDVSVIIALQDPERAAAVTAAIQEANPLAAAVVVGDGEAPAPPGLLASKLDLDGALRRTLQQELSRLETLKRVRALRVFAGEVPVVPILLHHDPDPDALASGLAIRALLQRRPRQTPILTLDEMTRPENRRMSELLDIQVTQVTTAELFGFHRVICADMQPRQLRFPARTHLAIIDHHPHETSYEAEFADIRPNYGATATILTEYLRATDERSIGERLATALLYGIRTDTDNLCRGVSAPDVSAYTFLLERADVPLLRRIERPALSDDAARAFGRAVAGLLLQNGVAVAYVDRIPLEEAHILADIADFCLTIEQATWAAAAALVDGKLVITLRHLGGVPGAGDVARELCRSAGSGGGHVTMARATVPLTGVWSTVAGTTPDNVGKILLQQLSDALERLQAK
jgi:nanoRNase/pAp phosphatase (c-di-AMP/oligoRNAs hydrolase)